MMSDTSTRPHATVGIEPAGASPDLGQLEITGQVCHRLTLSGDDLAALPRAHHVEEFVGKDGAPVVRRWQGVPLLQVLALAQPLEAARYVRVCAGSYALPVALAEAGGALLCDQLDGQPIPQRHGAPWRLLLPGGATHTSVRWIERLEVTGEPGSYDAGCGRTA
jgi:DMSO/TMAO reductase YedYZ molybdopterin-dependent catalytic subunit